MIENKGGSMARAQTKPTAPTARAPRATEGRRERRKRETRARLVEAATRVIGRGGLAAATIATVTEAADVGFGTFYSYFASLEELLQEAVAEILGALAESNDALVAGESDPAAALAIGLRHTVGLAERDPATAAFAISLIHSGRREPWEQLSRRMVCDLRQGFAAGRFRAAGGAVLTEMLSGSVLAVMRGRLEGRLGPKAGEELAAHALRLLGVEAEEAQGIARRPLPRVAPAAPERAR
jgi:AcrR family transcriptional regulator